MESANSTKRVEEILIVNALLHDIGKYLHRLNVKDYQSEEKKRMGKELRYAHPEWGYNFIMEEMRGICKIEDNLELLPLLTHHLETTEINKMKNTIKTFLEIDKIDDKKWDLMLKLQKIVRTADHYSASERDEIEEPAEGENKQVTRYKSIELVNPFSYVKRDFGNTFVCLKIDGKTGIYPNRKDRENLGTPSQIFKEFKDDIALLNKIENFKARINTLNSVLQKYLQFIPSSLYRTKSKKAYYPTVSLYEHLKTTAAIALSLYRTNNGRIGFILGDLSGIQKFIFNKYKQLENPAKILRGRSSFINLLTLLTIEKLKENFDLYDFNVIVNNGGNFLILTNPISEKDIKKIEKEINLFLIEKYGLTLTYSLTYKEFDISDVFGREDEFSNEERFVKAIKEIHLLNAEEKNRKFKGYLDEVVKSLNSDETLKEGQVCEICGLHRKKVGDRCEFCDELVKLGDAIRKKKLVFHKRTNEIKFKYKVGEEEKLTDLFKGILRNPKMESDIIIKINDTKIDSNEINENTEIKFLLIGNYVPYTDGKKEIDINKKDGANGEKSGLMTFEEIASDNKILTLFKSDIDNLSDLFVRKWDVQENKKISLSGTISRYSFVSFLINLFYSINLNELCEQNGAHYRPYIVFSGGDDLTTVINSSGAIEFIVELSKRFNEFFQNDEIHFSAGVNLFHHKKPVDKVIEMAEELLKKAKSYRAGHGDTKDNNKNAIAFDENLIIKREDLRSIEKIWNILTYGTDNEQEMKQRSKKENILSKSTLYFLLTLWNRLKEQEEQLEKAQILKREVIINENALLYYNLKRNMRIRDKEKREKTIRSIISVFKRNNQLSNEFKVALEFYLLKERKRRGGE